MTAFINSNDLIIIYNQIVEIEGGTPGSLVTFLQAIRISDTFSASLDIYTSWGAVGEYFH